MHCFNGNTSQMQEVMNLGYLVSFTGIVTFKNAAEVREAAKAAPIDRIMVETDAPYLAPIPNRGKRCEPGFVRDTASFIADLRGMSLGDFAHHTTQNARRFFELD
jgi:TatD DNase family protein